MNCNFQSDHPGIWRNAGLGTSSDSNPSNHERRGIIRPSEFPILTAGRAGRKEHMTKAVQPRAKPITKPIKPIVTPQKPVAKPQ